MRILDKSGGITKALVFRGFSNFTGFPGGASSDNETSVRVVHSAGDSRWLQEIINTVGIAVPSNTGASVARCDHDARTVFQSQLI